MAAGDWKDLLKAVQEGDLSLVRHHVQNGVDINYQHPEFLTTPLIASIEAAEHTITEYLLQNGADPNLAAGFSSDTPFTVAKQCQNKKALKLLKPYQKSFWKKITTLIGFNRGAKP